MKLLILLTTVACLQVSARVHGQSVTLSLEKAPIERAFAEIKKQTGYSFIYTRTQLKNAQPVTILVSNADLKAVLALCFQNQPLSYIIEDKYVVVQNKPVSTGAKNSEAATDINGKVLNENGEPMEGVTVLSKNTGRAAVTDKKGEFVLTGIAANDILIITSIGYYKKEIPVVGQTYFNVQLSVAVGTLDETIVMAYGKTSRRLNTGSIGKLNADEISKQPVSNPLAALQGRIPGVLITQSSGVPGSSYNIEIRGRSTIDQSLSRNDPLIVIDGVPFEPGNLPTNLLRSSANKPLVGSGGLSPLNTINPSSIESIEVLKDADATAIYGSRGANGVILITTKAAKPGATSVSANVSSGISNITRSMDMLNTQQYVAMRREAFRNDNRAITNFSAPDLLLWDTTRYTDFKKLLIGNTARFTDAQLNLSGGSALTKFLIGAGYHYETNVFSKNLSDQRISFNSSFSHSTTDKRLTVNLTTYYANDRNKLVQSDMTQFINLPPNFLWKDAAGNPNWSEGGYSITTFPFLSNTTPLAELAKKYSAINENLSANLLLSYRILKHVVFRTNFGFNKFTTEEKSQTPKLAIDPASSQLPFAGFSNSSSKNWIAEPQLEYTKQSTWGRINILAGGTWQERKSNSTVLNGYNYTNDLLLESPNAAGNITVANNSSQYRYTAFFGRVNYNYKDRYIVNVSARRDGSSRFGPENQFATFGAVGAAWIFSNESFLHKENAVVSFGKLRVSYGKTGNDQIGEYRYLNLWNSTPFPYQNNPTLEPVSLYNPYLEWEENKKLEAAIELGFYKNRLLISAAYYRNRSSNQLVNYLLPDQTGFTSIAKNLAALVENNGVELTVSTKNIDTKNIKWNTQLSITIPRNKLISFPGLANSSYNYLYKEGASLNVGYQFVYKGVNAQTGVYEVEDLNRDGAITFPDDYSFGASTDPDFFGGLQNTVQFKGFEFSFFLDFRKQLGRNYLGIIGGNHPGLPVNQPVIVLDRWQQPGDNNSIQKYTSRLGGPAGLGASYLGRSNGILSDASFVRLKNISVSYSLTEKVSKQIGMKSCNIYLQAQNVALFTNYKGSDPETQDFYVLPPLRTIVAGLKLNF